MEITARLTGDAKVNTLKDERQIVNFNVAVNDSYRTKGISEIKKITTYIHCFYWLKPAITQYLTKGTLVELHGRIGVNAYKDMQGEPKASLTFHVSNIKLHGGSKSTGKEKSAVGSISANEITEPLDDLPF